MHTYFALVSLLSVSQGDSASIAAALRVALDAPVMVAARWSDIGDVRDGVRAAYEKRGWTLFWTAGGRAGPATAGVLRELATAQYRGLDPADYDAARLTAELDSLVGRGDERAARFDALLTVAATRYAIALDRGRVDPRSLHPTLRHRRDPFDVPAFLASIATIDTPSHAFRNLEPTFFQYRRLQSVLVTYRLLARDSASLALPEMPKRLRLGMTYAGSAQLRRLLTLLGDLADTSAVAYAAGADTVYEASLARAVRRFQGRHGFGMDGIIGDSTRSRLTRTFGDRVRQIELTLERWRWLPRGFDTPPLIVNIPEFRLHAFRSTEDVESEMLSLDVVVGTAVKNDTPLLAVEMSALQFQPQWNVPQSIMRDEIRPKALKDSTYLARENYELLRGNTILPITDSNIAKIGYGVRVRQMAGPTNALGRVKFVMPNPEDIYLHDTPSKGFFARVRRDFSHGCIRVSDPAALAAFLLRDNPAWPRARIDSAMAGDKSIWVPLARRVPVYLVYHSAVVLESGKSFFYRDVYNHDRALDRALRKGYPYVRPAPTVPRIDSATTLGARRA